MERTHKEKISRITEEFVRLTELTSDQLRVKDPSQGYLDSHNSLQNRCYLSHMHRQRSNGIFGNGKFDHIHLLHLLDQLYNKNS